MSLATNIANLATRVGTEFKAVYAKIGTLGSLTTTNKTDLVSAVNEIKALIPATGAVINDAAASGISTYSSTKINALDASTLTSAQSYADTQVATKPSVNDVTPSAANTFSSNKINTLLATKPVINDSSAATTSVYSSTKTDSQISTAVSGLVASAPAALDTLNELSAALGNDANYATTTSTALGNRVRFDAAQTLTAPQQAQAQANISVPSTTQVGDTTTDFVAAFVAALV